MAPREVGVPLLAPAPLKGGSSVVSSALFSRSELAATVATHCSKPTALRGTVLLTLRTAESFRTLRARPCPSTSCAPLDQQGVSFSLRATFEGTSVFRSDGVHRLPDQREACQALVAGNFVVSPREALEAAEANPASFAQPACFLCSLARAAKTRPW